MSGDATASAWPPPTLPSVSRGDGPPAAREDRVPFSILLVDDNAVNRLSLARWLEKRGGYQVAMAEDGAEALRRIDKDPFDLVVLDVMMPVMGGFEVLRRLREIYTPDELPVIMATARDRSEDMVEAFDLGANDYIVKPIDYPVALARVRAQLRTRDKARQRPRQLSTIAPIHRVRPGMVLEDKYLLDEMIGAGSHGAVYRATHLRLNREVAIKVLHTGLGDDTKALEHFQKEGISACQVDHPNAVAVLDFTVTSRGLVFLVMELLRGRSLREELRREGRLSPERTAEILFPICDVLSEAHAVGILHRDVKPQNIFLHRSRRGEVVKVLDFGLAKLLENAAEDEDPTLDGIAGTLAYIAPERVTAEPYDGRADVYSLGITLYEMLTGRLPYVEETSNPVQMMMMHVRRSPPPLTDWVPELDPAVERVIFEALEKIPRLRLTAGQLKERFAEAVGMRPATEAAGLGDQSGFVLRELMEREAPSEVAARRNGRRRKR